jgi:hypothetical protein
MTNEQINYMVERFLNWELPDDFNPDCGISFEKYNSEGIKREPIGTNLFYARQAEDMVRYMIKDLPQWP